MAHVSTLAKGISTRDVVAACDEMYDADVLAALISKVTDGVLDAVNEWQSRPVFVVYLSTSVAPNRTPLGSEG